MLLHLDILMVCIPTSVSFGWFYFLVTILPSTFGPIYGFNTGTIGLCYLAGGIGNTAGSIVAGAISDKLYAKAVAKNNGVAQTEFRLRPMYIGLPLIVLGSAMYGWFLQSGIHWMGPLASYTISKLLLFVLKHRKTKQTKIIISNLWYYVYNHCGQRLHGRL